MSYTFAINIKLYMCGISERERKEHDIYNMLSVGIYTGVSFNLIQVSNKTKYIYY